VIAWQGMPWRSESESSAEASFIGRFKPAGLFDLSK
jgi:hypothetical protein